MSTTIIEELTQGLRETREEVRTLRMLLAEQGKRIANTEVAITKHGPPPEMLEAPASEPRSVWMMAVKCAAADWFVTETQILGRERTVDIAIARHVARHLLKRVANLDISVVARLCGAHKETVRWSLDQIDAVIDTNPKARERIRRTESQFKALISARSVPQS